MKTGILLLCMLALMNRQRKTDNCVIIYLYKIDKGFSYTPETKMKFKNALYQPYKLIEYKKAKLSSASIYKSDGIIKYYLKDLLNDPQLLRVLKAPLRLDLEIKPSYLNHNHIKYMIQSHRQDSTFVVNKDELVIYIR